VESYFKKYIILPVVLLLITANAYSAQWIHDSALDACHAYVATCTRVDIVSDAGTPANLNNTLANVTVTAGTGNGDWTIGNGDVSGRKLNLTEQADVPITGTGIGRKVVYSLSGTIIYWYSITEISLTASGTITIATYDIEIKDL